MNRSLISIFLMVASTQVLAEPLKYLPSISVPEPSIVSLLAAGIIALGIARRRAAK